MSNEQSNDFKSMEGETVTSAGNAWIICRSKTYTGRIYYFNTATGKALWNLSPAEEAKAKERTQQTLDCPEPLEPPADKIQEAPQNHNVSTRKGSEMEDKLMNASFANQPFPIPPIVVPQCNAFNYAFPFNPLAYNNAPPFNNQIFPLPPAPPICIPHNMSIPPPNMTVPPPNMVIPPNMIIPPASITTNQLQQSFYNNLDNLPRSLIHQLNLQDKTHNFRNRKSHEYGNRSYVERQNSTKKIYQNNYFKDLRQVLSAKRRIRSRSLNITNEEQEGDVDDQLQNNSEEKEKVKDEVAPVPSHSEVIDIQDDEKARKYNLGNLHKLAGDNRRSNRWYLVTDAEVLMLHLDFIKDIISQDSNCHLLLPLSIMEALRLATRSQTSQQMTNARAAIRYFLELQKKEQAEIDKDMSEAYNDDKELPILETALKIARNDMVIIISENEKIQRRKSRLKVPVFSMAEIKLFLATDVDKTFEVLQKMKQSDVFSSMTSYTEDSPNLNPWPERNASFTYPSEHQNITNVLQQPNIVCDFAPQPHNAMKEIQANVVQTNLKIDAAVQTDDDKDIQVSIGVGTENSETANNISEKNNEIDVVDSPKKIRLRRSMPIKSTIVNRTTEKKHKWRSRNLKLATNQESTTIPKSVSQAGTSDDSGYKNSDCNFTEVPPAYSLIEVPNETHIPDDNVESDADSFLSKLRTPRQNVTVEESSTSGIISNSVSNVDSDSTRSIYLRQSYNNSKNVTNRSSSSFAVNHEKFEDYLKTRIDEWVFRFVEIMEEVLTQVLIQDPNLSNVLPPPWTIREATICIIDKFKDGNVSNAANDLNLILLKISDKSGKIKTDLQPSEYMKMFKCGADLIDMLQNLLKDHEDLQVARRLLEKILIEMSDPNYDINDTTFLDSVHDISANASFNTDENEKSVSAEIFNSLVEKSAAEELCKDIDTPKDTSKKYLTRSSKKKEELAECDFMSTLELQKAETQKSHNNMKLVSSKSKTNNQKDTQINEKKRELENKQLSLPVVVEKETKRRKIRDKSDATTSNHIPREIEKSNNHANFAMNEKPHNVSKNDKDSTKTASMIDETKLLKNDSNLNNVTINYKKTADVESLTDITKTCENNEKHNESRKSDENVTNCLNVERENSEKNMTDKVNEPKIVRNFTLCKEYEEKLKAKVRLPLDLDQLDYDYYDSEDEEVYDSCQETEHTNQDNFQNANIESGNSDYYNIDGNIFMKNTLNVVNQTLRQSQQFCENCSQVIKRWESLSGEKKKEFRQKTLQVHLKMSNICKDLNSFRTPNEECKKDVDRLHACGVNLEYEDFVSYRNILTESTSQGNKILDTLNLIRECIN